MAGTIGTGKPENPQSLQLTDGQSHPLLNVASLGVIVIGLVSFVLGMVLRYGTSTKALAITAAVTGLVALLVGLYTQMVSATRIERILLVTGMIAGFVGLALGLAHGAFS
jgi:FtsH-binding integral membrane protein